jgi:UDP-N-acetylmuramoyl-tripeptide--D-alanyl-D-alanine ligase
MNKIFPYRLQLQIFQLDEYNVKKFFSWIVSHFLTRSVENKKPLVFTQKANILYFLSILFAISATIKLTFFFGIIGFVVGIILATQAYLFLLLAYLVLSPFEIYKKNKIKTQTKEKIKQLKNLKVIGITGSYGKTSVKEFLYQILKTKYKVLKTPESYNTLLGVAKVADLELDSGYEYFICEMGAYKIGEIKEICNMVNPQYGIITGINKQHLETFGSLANIIKGKFELIDAIPQNGFAVVNADSGSILSNLKKYNKKIITYGFSDKKFSAEKINGNEFVLILDGKKYTAKTKLVGNANLQNILAAATMAFSLGLSDKQIVSAIAEIKSVSHRLEIIETENMTIIDDSYNSNVNGFKEAVSLLKTFNGPKVFVTPGIVDLGKETISVHKDLGCLLDFEYIFLIGKSDRTEGLKIGIKDKEKIIELNSINDFWTKLKELKLKNPTVLLENDLPGNY